MGNNENAMNKKWYHHPLVIGWLLVMCSPLAVYLWWQSDYFGKTIKKIIAGIALGAVFVACVCFTFMFMSMPTLSEKIVTLVGGPAGAFATAKFAQYLFKNKEESVSNL